MMGYGAMSMAPWLFGAIAVATIWGGLWWLLTAIGYSSNAEMRPKQLAPTQPPPEQATTAWQQPSFEQPDPARRPNPIPTRAKPESDYR